MTFEPTLRLNLRARTGPRRRKISFMLRFPDASPRMTHLNASTITAGKWLRANISIMHSMHE
jgi:hypothetical protein